MLERLKEVHRLLDQLEAAKADIRSDSPELVAHGLGALAALATDMAAKADRVPGAGRIAAFMREQAADALEGKREIEGALERRRENMQSAIDEYSRAMRRLKATEEKRREELRHEAEHGEQPDMFGNFTEKGRQRRRPNACNDHP